MIGSGNRGDKLKHHFILMHKIAQITIRTSIMTIRCDNIATKISCGSKIGCHIQKSKDPVIVQRVHVG